MKKLGILCCVAAALAIASATARGQADLAPTPPMGWNSWNHFYGKIDDATVRAMADALVSSDNCHRPVSSGKEGDRASAEGPVEIWLRPLVNGGAAAGIFNRHPGPMMATVDLGKLGLGHAPKVCNVWAATDTPLPKGPVSFSIPGHGVVLLRVSQ